MELETIIGLEIHVQQKTKTKMFCSCDNTGEDKAPNSCICPVCLGHPGTLPVANKKAIKWSALAALAINCKIDPYSKFDRKHYYYPDLPKAYQISQFDQPIGKNGYLYVLNPQTKQEEKIRINRLHLEEDAAKLHHSKDKKNSLVDYNRGGTPLMEIVTEPDIKNPEQAKLFLQDLRQIMRSLDVSNADMEKGHLRCDANISLRPPGDQKYYSKTEIKNLNSFKAVEKALEYEISRQQKLWLEGNAPDIQTTRGWNDSKGITEEQRTKEESSDYRYFPEPDIPPIHFFTEQDKKCDPNEIAIDIDCLKPLIPELPNEKRKRFIGEYGLALDDVKVLTLTKEISNFTEQAFSELQKWVEHIEKAAQDKPAGGGSASGGNIWEKNRPQLIKLASNLIINKLIPLLEEQETTIEQTKLNPENMAELISLIFAKKINNQTAAELLPEMIKSGADPSHLIKDKGLEQISNESELENIIDQVIKENPGPAEDYKNGKEKAVQALVGKTMAATKGKANAEIVLNILKNKLNK